MEERRAAIRGKRGEGGSSEGTGWSDVPKYSNRYKAKSSLRDVFRSITYTVDVFCWHLWAAPLKAYGAVLRTPLPRLHYQTICLPKNVLTAALPPFVEVAVDDE